MSENKHTPGPWRYVSKWDSIIDVHGNAVVKPTYDGVGPGIEISSGDLALVTAAPDMLEALEHFIEWYHSAGADPNEYHCHEESILNAIAKAKGESK